MSRYSERAAELRSSFKPNGMPAYNCAQTMVMAMHEETGLDEETLRQLAEHFGGGMKMGSVCGAFTGGLMILGLCGIDDNESRNRFIHSLKEKHGQMIECRDLLKANAERGGDKKTHCDGMIYDAIEILEEIINEKKKAEKSFL
jgi:C_GCAxxG_C_C family probable redox protein